MTTIEHSDLVFEDRVGVGRFATVYKGRWKSRGVTVAIKTSAQEISSSELEVWRLVDHPNLLHFFGTVLQQPIFCIVTEYMEQGALFDFLHQNEFDSNQNLMWAKQVAAGMKYLHCDVPGRVVIHGDLNSKNVLVSANSTVKICDFGLSKLHDHLSGVSIHATTKVLGTPRWMAPEVLENKPISKQCDVYSYGIVVWELLTHKIPFEDATLPQICKRVAVDKERPPIPENCSPALAILLKAFWEPNPSLRPEFAEVLSEMEQLSNLIVAKELPSQLQTNSQSFCVESDVNFPEVNSPPVYIPMRKMDELSENLPHTKTKKPWFYQDTQPVWAISREEVELLSDELGRGAWGIVTKAWFRGEIVAAKRLHETLSQENPEFLHKAIRREMDIVSNLRHPNLVLFLGAVIERDLREVIILNELMDSSLRDILAEGQLSRSQIKFLSIDIARALNYLHSCKPQPLIHRDVSSANVLLQRLGPDYWKAKLSDYGSLQAINLACTLAPGSPVYAAPEAMHIGGQQSCKVDTYSFGVLLIEMLSRQLPTPELRARLLQEIKWQEMYLLIETCIQAYPDDRPTMQHIISSLEQIPGKNPLQQPVNNYLEMRWFVPSVSQIESENKLATEGKEGNFLVRISTTKSSKYSLSIFYDGKVHHYRIWQSESGDFYIDENVLFQSLEEMIEFYKKSKGGLSTKLCEYMPTRQGSLKHQSSLTDKVWEISRAELTCGSEIAKGQCGYVVAGVWKGLDVAIRITNQDSLDEAGLQFIGDALKVLKEFHHGNLVKFYGMSAQEGPLLIVTELMPRGSLDKYIKQHQELLDKKDIILDMGTQICSAMKFLHARGLIHGDLAARNCQVGEGNVVKVADYSLALYTSSRKPSRTVVAVRWAAPELIVQYPIFTTKSDVWSFGIVMWELWSGAQTPYLGLPNHKVKGKLLAGHRLEKPGNCPDEVYTLMCKCWNLDAQQRPSFAHLHEKLRSLAACEELGELQEPQLGELSTRKPTSTGRLYCERLETSKPTGNGACGKPEDRQSVVLREELASLKNKYEELERVKQEKEERERTRLRNRQKGYKQFGLSSDVQPLFAAEVLQDQPKMKDHLGVTTGEIVYVLVLRHAELPDAMYLVEKDNGTIGYVKRSITKRMDNHSTVGQPPFPKATSGQQCYSAILDYTTTADDEVEAGLEVKHQLIQTETVETKDKHVQAGSTTWQQGYLRGVEVIDQTSFTYTRRAQSLEWRRFGLKMHFEEDALPFNVNECQIHIKASLSGQFQLPEDTELLSSIYWIVCPHKFMKPVTVEIQHCATMPEHQPGLTFIIAKCTQQHLPYKFKVLNGGVFSPSSQYGSIELSHFSGVGVAFQSMMQWLGFTPFQPKFNPRSYRAQLYYSSSGVHSWEVYLAITWNLELHITAVDAKYAESAARVGPDQEVMFEEEMITLDIAAEGVVLENGWTITPHIHPGITKHQVDCYVPGHRVPSCQLYVKWTGQQEQPVELMHRVKLLGAKEPYNFFLIRLPAPPAPPGIVQQMTSISESASVRQGEWTEKIQSKPNFKKLLDALYHKVADRWRMIGIYLEIPKGKLASIAEKYKDDPNSCLVQMLETWLEQVNPSATWTAIIEAVEFLGEEQLGKELKEKYTMN